MSFLKNNLVLNAVNIFFRIIFFCYVKCWTLNICINSYIDLSNIHWGNCCRSVSVCLSDHNDNINAIYQIYRSVQLLFGTCDVHVCRSDDKNTFESIVLEFYVTRLLKLNKHCNLPILVMADYLVIQDQNHKCIPHALWAKSNIQEYFCCHIETVGTKKNITIKISTVLYYFAIRQNSAISNQLFM